MSKSNGKDKQLKQALKDKAIRRQVVQAVLADPHLKQGIIQDVLEHLRRNIETQSKIMTKIVYPALSHSEFKQQIKKEIWG